MLLKRPDTAVSEVDSVIAIEETELMKSSESMSVSATPRCDLFVPSIAESISGSINENTQFKNCEYGSLNSNP